MSIFWWLLFAHFLADFSFQTEFMATTKGKFPYTMFAHSYIWAGIISIALVLFGAFAPWKFLFLLVGHVFCDTIKSSFKTTPENFWMIYPDQAFHWFQLLVVMV